MNLEERNGNGKLQFKFSPETSLEMLGKQIVIKPRNNLIFRFVVMCIYAWCPQFQMEDNKIRNNDSTISICNYVFVIFDFIMNIDRAINMSYFLFIHKELLRVLCSKS